MKTSTKIIIAVVSILGVLVIWGLIGSSQSADIGITCDIGLGDDGSMLCWKWHKNTIGQIGEAIGGLFNK